ncbi:hypothetical protein BKG96_06675 [Rodentibacter caecimuris]|uniref:Uncharacterized protein n=1 Tax=Rodentibacter caecimuris TaxID=1796644 RepID=A0A1V3KKG8_9PAST|nr:hypothetical protein [Rodentibacter heylii]OOF78172.1 hypothetical protein BKG96_06675 [Rodentibacter heylii]
MKWRTLNSNLLDFMGLLSEEALNFFEKSLNKFEIVSSPFSIEINSYVSIQCLVEDNVATILSFNYGRYSYLNFGNTEKEIEFIRALETRYFESASYIELSSKNRRKLILK